jgi:hypothetical protein
MTSLLKRIAKSNGDLKRAIGGLRLLNERLECELIERASKTELLAKLLEEDSIEAEGVAKVMGLLNRISRSNGSPERTIAALRLINERLKQELRRPK